ncbi:MAG: serine dehydrogenasease [Alphaproteobacteria bacterium]|nr:serine dehydrogenasease [Alphaproteobacteria bacterium]
MKLCNLDNNIIECFNNDAKKIANKLKTDILLYYGPIALEALPLFRDVIENNKKATKSKETLSFIITTTGGSAEAAAKMVEILRYHYKNINIFIPEYAMSAGTILALSGDNICMDYYSSLGPVDPQVPVRKDGSIQYVPALGYLEQAELLIKKSLNNTISPVEYAMLRDMDLAMLKLYEQAKNLSIQLIKDWLVKYKFKDWTTHQSNSEKKGQPVTKDEKINRANEIASMFSDYNLWLSHGRRISIDTLQKDMKLKVDDYTGKDEQLLIRKYNDAIITYTMRIGKSLFMHTPYSYGEL